MKRKTYLGVIVAVASIAMLALLSAPVSVAQECGGATEGSVVVESPEIELILDGSGLIGDNYIDIPAFSIVNDFPNRRTENGYHLLCDIFSLAGSDSEIVQIDPENGIVHTFLCSQVPAPKFLPCQGVRIKPWGVSTPIIGRIPMDDDTEGVDGSWYYPVWTEDPSSVKGDHFFGIPYTIADTSPQQLCQDLHLPDPNSGWGTVTWIDAKTGILYTHNCGQLPVFSLTPGQAVIVKSSSDTEGHVPIE